MRPNHFIFHPLWSPSSLVTSTDTMASHSLVNFHTNSSAILLETEQPNRGTLCGYLLCAQRNLYTNAPSLWPPGWPSLTTGSLTMALPLLWSTIVAIYAYKKGSIKFIRFAPASTNPWCACCIPWDRLSWNLLEAVCEPAFQSPLFVIRCVMHLTFRLQGCLHREV